MRSTARGIPTLQGGASCDGRVAHKRIVPAWRRKACSGCRAFLSSYADDDVEDDAGDDCQDDAENDDDNDDDVV